MFPYIKILNVCKDGRDFQHYQVRDGRVLPAQVFHFLQDVIEDSQHLQLILALYLNRAMCAKLLKTESQKSLLKCLSLFNDDRLSTAARI